MKRQEQFPHGTGYRIMTVVKRKIKNVVFPLQICVKVAKIVIWNYVLRRDLVVLDAAALRWLWFGRHECTALEGEGP